MLTIRWLREQMRQGKSIFDLPLRVTFYARVSTEKVEQQGSLENQIQYYTEFIQKNPNWTYISGYIDEGISGTIIRHNPWIIGRKKRHFLMKVSG